MKDLYHRIGVVHLLDAKDIDDDDTYSNILDLQGFEGAAVIVNVGAITGVGANDFLTPVLEESDTTVDGDFEAVAASDMIGAFTKIDAAAEDQVTQMVGYIGSKRYIRVKLDITDGGAIGPCLVSVDGIVGHAHTAPVTAPAAVTAT